MTDAHPNCAAVVAAGGALTVTSMDGSMDLARQLRAELNGQYGTTRTVVLVTLPGTTTPDAMGLCPVHDLSTPGALDAAVGLALDAARQTMAGGASHG